MALRLSLRLWTEFFLGALSGAALLLTLAEPDWLERFFGLAPDAGDGSTEWGLAIALAVATVVLLLDARRVQVRAARASLPKT
ncbi:MAG: ABC transporter permease [Alphaproteobacteria bacterium]